MSLDDEKPAQPSAGSGSEQPSSGAASATPDSKVLKPKGLRTITDARTMRAMAHPVRIAIMETLGLGGPMTATEVGERIEESPTTCSFHLRQLAKYGFVEEAGGGKGRARPWRVVTLGFNIPAAHEDPEVDVAASVLARVIRERQLARYMTWVDTRGSYPREWREAATNSQYAFYLTAEEMKQFDSEMQELLGRWFAEAKRITDPSLRPPGAVPVEMLVFAYPLEVPEPGAASESGAGESGAGESAAGESGASEPEASEPGTGGTGDAEEGAR
jgi:DNA-binding transcriptional ArsR family regulator